MRVHNSLSLGWAYVGRRAGLLTGSFKGEMTTFNTQLSPLNVDMLSKSMLHTVTSIVFILKTLAWSCLLDLGLRHHFIPVCCHIFCLKFIALQSCPGHFLSFTVNHWSATLEHLWIEFGFSYSKGQSQRFKNKLGEF